MTAPTAALLDPVLDALKRRQLRQIEHLPRLRLHNRRIRQIPSTALAALDRMQDGTIRILAALKMMTLMPGLPPGLRPERRRRLRFFSAVGYAYPSDDGGLEELREFRSTRSRNSATSASSSPIR
jgi:hypothetical protein